MLGALNSLLVTMKGLPMTYNRDMQEDKEPLFEAADQVNGSLEMARAVAESVVLQPAASRRRRRGKLGGRDGSCRSAGARTARRSTRRTRSSAAWCSKACAPARSPPIGPPKTLAALRPRIHARYRRVCSIPREGMKTREIPGGTGPHAVAAALDRRPRNGSES